MNVFEPDQTLRWLFCMTHPDDEISICAWITRLATSHPEKVFISWTHHTPTREQEARAVAAKLHVPQENLFFHTGEDGSICDQMGELMPEFSLMMERIAPDRVVCGAFEQGHLDHDATNFMVNQTHSGPVFEVPFYHTYRTRMPRVNRFADPTGAEVLRLEPAERDLKRDIAKSYPSQAIWKNMVFAELRARLTGDGSLLATEHMRMQSHLDFRKPNLPPKLAIRIEQTARWQRWVRAVTATESGGEEARQ